MLCSTSLMLLPACSIPIDARATFSLSFLWPPYRNTRPGLCVLPFPDLVTNHFEGFRNSTFKTAPIVAPNICCTHRVAFRFAPFPPAPVSAVVSRLFSLPYPTGNRQPAAAPFPTPHYDTATLGSSPTQYGNGRQIIAGQAY